MYAREPQPFWKNENRSSKDARPTSHFRQQIARTDNINREHHFSQVLKSGLDDKVEALDHKVEERLHDTRPIWERLVTDVAQLQEGQQRLEEGQQRLEKRCEERFDSLQKESREIKTFMRDILRRMSIFFDTLVTMQADYRDIYDRVRSLEIKNG
jgi:hypothetical protein